MHKRIYICKPYFRENCLKYITPPPPLFFQSYIIVKILLAGHDYI